jgi:hypothetical protein
VQLQRSLPDIKRAGLGLVAVSYDSQATLRAFADKHAITFPMLSDQGSKTITAWGILNREATGRSAGVPYPGTYVLDTSGRIVSRNFEQAYQERDSAASIIAALQQSAKPTPLGPAGSELLGRYVKLRVGSTDPVAAPGHRITLTVDVTPGPKIHVYAPGQNGYISIALTMNPSPDFTSTPAKFPAARPFVDPLGERVQVYDQPFRVSQDVTLTLTPSMRQRATAREPLTITGTFEYQACDDQVCYRPETIPLTWTTVLTPLEP